MEPLAEWMVRYVRHKDAFARKLKEVEELDDRIVFHYKDHDVVGYARERLEPIASKEKILFVVPNSAENVQALLREWEAFCKRDIVIIFVHLESNEKWLIRPSSHDAIAEDVEAGIRTLAASVPTL